jgi:carbon monoxide dehydrogenase subunit G
MLRFEGVREFHAVQAELFEKLTDARFLVSCVPDVDLVRLQQKDRANFVIRPGLAFVRGTLDVEMMFTEIQAPTQAQVTLHSKGIGATSEVVATLVFASTDTLTQVTWTAEVKNLTGLLKLVPTGLIRGAAEKVINDAWDRIEKKLLG